MYIYITVCFYLNLEEALKFPSTYNLHYSMFLFKLNDIAVIFRMNVFTLQYVSI